METDRMETKGDKRSHAVPASGENETIVTERHRDKGEYWTRWDDGDTGTDDFRHAALEFGQGDAFAAVRRHTSCLNALLFLETQLPVRSRCLRTGSPASAGLRARLSPTPPPYLPCFLQHSAGFLKLKSHNGSYVETRECSRCSRCRRCFERPRFSPSPALTSLFAS